LTLKTVYQRLPTFSQVVRSHHGRMARDMAVIAGFILVAKLVAAGKEVVVAHNYGVGPEVDAYLFTFTLLSLPATIWFSVLHAVLIPLIGRLRARDEQRSFLSELLGLTTLLSLASAITMWVSLRIILDVWPLGLEPVTQRLAISSVDVLIFILPLGFLINLGAAVMMARGKHANSLLEGVPSLVLLLSLLIWNGGGIEVLIWATLAGTALQLVLTAGALKERIEPPRFSFSSPAWSTFRSGVAVMLVAQLLLASTTVVDQFFAADLGTGAISSLGYATRVLGIFLALGATVIGRATLPIYVELGRANPTGVARTALKWSLLMLVAGSVALVFGWWGAEIIISGLFERGEFNSRDTAEVSALLKLGMFQLPFYFAWIAASQALFSAHRFRLAAGLAACGLAVKIGLNMLLVPLIGLGGLMLSTAAVHGLSYAILFYVLVAVVRSSPRVPPASV